MFVMQYHGDDVDTNMKQGLFLFIGINDKKNTK